MRLRSILGIFGVLVVVLGLIVGCDLVTVVPAVTEPVGAVGQVVDVQAEPQGHAKYIFVFIGDGMGVAQRNSAELYLAATAEQGVRPEHVRLVMNTLPAQGMNTTYDLTSVVPDSASTATAIATGNKTASGVINMDPLGTVAYKTIAEVAKERGWRVGVISSVSLDHATPAAFYAHQPSRGNMYEIAIELANSGFDYFAGGRMHRPTSKEEGKPNAIDVAIANGYAITSNRAEFEALRPGTGKVIAFSERVDSGSAMHYALDRTPEDLSLPEFVAKGIELLSHDNSNGFLLAVEGGKIDWAGHANDAAASIHDVIEFDEAVAVALRFYEEHPDETLIIVTGDHETGGMTIGFAGTRYDSFFEKIQYQTMSYIGFDTMLAEYKAGRTSETAKFEDVLPLIEQAFGLVTGQPENPMNLTELELVVMEEAFADSMKDVEVRPKDEYTYLLYGGYEPLTVKCTTILNQKAGIGWTSYSHTGTPVQTSAIGVGHGMFNGYYDQTDIYTKMVTIAGF